MTGMRRVASSARMRRVSSKPSSLGIITSSTARSGWASRIRSQASSPSCAWSTVYPERSSRNVTSSSTSASSSAASTTGCGSPSGGWGAVIIHLGLLRGGRGVGEVDAEGGADVEGAGDLDGAAVGVGGGLGDGQAQPGPDHGPGVGGPVEAVEDVVEVRGGHAHAGVGHLDDHPVALGGGGHGDGAGSGGELDGVGQQVVDQGPQAHLVAPDGGQPVG